MPSLPPGQPSRLLTSKSNASQPIRWAEKFRSRFERRPQAHLRFATKSLSGWASVLLLLAFCSFASAAQFRQRDDRAASPRVSDTDLTQLSDADQEDIAMAATIDRLLAESWAREEITPAQLADDAEFVRRAWLDLAGAIPPLNDRSEAGDFGVRGFLADDRPDKRRRLVDHLMSRSTFPERMATVWSNVMVPDDTNTFQYGSGFHNWLRYKFRINEHYDSLVTELLLARGNPSSTGPILFYASSDGRPEEIAAAASRVFLGVQIQCAQCHDHPVDDWSQDEFWEFAAFFARVKPSEEGQQFASMIDDSDVGELMYPNSELVITPRFLRGEASPDDHLSRRQRLANWVTAPENPYFADAAVNRVWAMLFGKDLSNQSMILAPTTPLEFQRSLINSRIISLRSTLTSSDWSARLR